MKLQEETICKKCGKTIKINDIFCKYCTSIGTFNNSQKIKSFSAYTLPKPPRPKSLILGMIIFIVISGINFLVKDNTKLEKEFEKFGTVEFMSITIICFLYIYTLIKAFNGYRWARNLHVISIIVIYILTFETLKKYWSLSDIFEVSYVLCFFTPSANEFYNQWQKYKAPFVYNM